MLNKRTFVVIYQIRQGRGGSWMPIIFIMLKIIVNIKN